MTVATLYNLVIKCFSFTNSSSSIPAGIQLLEPYLSSIEELYLALNDFSDLPKGEGEGEQSESSVFDFDTHSVTGRSESCLYHSIKLTSLTSLSVFFGWSSLLKLKRKTIHPDAIY